MIAVLLATYGIVFVTELLGDKTLYTLGTLATRYRMLPVFAGSAAAFAVKMLAAVLLGRLIGQLPPVLVAGLTVLTFVALGIAIWLRRGEEARSEWEERHWSRVALMAFAAIFFTEWGDPGQVAAAALAARFQMPWVVWTGATLALCTKGILAITLGLGLRRWLPARPLRYGALALCLIMAVVSALRLEL